MCLCVCVCRKVFDALCLVCVSTTSLLMTMSGAHKFLVGADWGDLSYVLCRGDLALYTRRVV